MHTHTRLSKTFKTKEEAVDFTLKFFTTPNIIDRYIERSITQTLTGYRGNVIFTGTNKPEEVHNADEITTFRYA